MPRIDCVRRHQIAPVLIISYIGNELKKSAVASRLATEDNDQESREAYPRPKAAAALFAVICAHKNVEPLTAARPCIHSGTRMIFFPPAG
jgi:hypothetical protein